MANISILAAFDRMWQHIVVLVNGKSDVNHTHDDKYYTETEIDTKISDINASINGKADYTHNHDNNYDEKGSANTALDSAKTYTDTKTSNLASTTVVDNKISEHNNSTAVHNDIRELIGDLTTRLNALANSTDKDLDQMAEIVTYIKANRELIDSITTSKVNVLDIVDNLTTNVSNKPLSAAQGVAIKALIDALQEEVDGKVPTSRSINGKALISDINITASDVGTYTDSEIDTKVSTLNDNIVKTYETKVDATNKYTESKAYTDTEVAKKATLGSDGFYRSKRDFVNGTLITTNIDYSKSHGVAWLLELKGNAYSGGIPFDIMLQGYIYNDSMINCYGISNGNFFDDIVAFCYNGVLCFWFPTLSYWQGFAVRVTDEMANVPKSETENCVVSITDEAKPTDITKEVSFVGLISNSITSKNIGNQSVLYATVAASASKADNATNASNAEFARNALKDDNGNTIHTTYETKANVANKADKDHNHDNYVDLTSAQTISGVKTFSEGMIVNGVTISKDSTFGAIVFSFGEEG